MAELLERMVSRPPLKWAERGVGVAGGRGTPGLYAGVVFVGIFLAMVTSRG